ncbi:aminotransferase class I/II-fold pyridoxal phosphate-dependent enzyme [Ruminococcus sp. NK3A76]|uniref:aminotransferase class I/II-fold pyridoxal phosphate-dependent enzyme n=1 Tax=Ruminococcus sp. NK3A76 TaxID=877411 RepID=UPI00048DFB1A|nr:aminotransferase class I/II-fold pyridoxal phosphate-dependent enzyme [Ruminococcus sp. NK3A76]
MLMTEMTKEQLEGVLADAMSEYEGYKALGLALNMARGKPAADQLSLTKGMLDAVNSSSDCKALDGTDCRNYGVLDGIKDTKKIFCDMLGVADEELIVGGNSSLNLMYDTIARNYMFGVSKDSTPLKDQGKLKWLCPVPGYDRHFAITERFGFEMINIPIGENGPDMDMIEKLVSEDESIKGIWCVPMYANPTGITYSDETVKRFASLKPKAKDFRIFWDNAYCIHHLTDTPDTLLNILDECKKAGNDDMVYIFASTSKVSFAGAGVAVMAASKANTDYVKYHMTVQTIGFDKINQLRHAKFFGDFEGVKAHMKKHAAIIAPKFDAVIKALDENIKPLGIGSYNTPKGGYFIAFDTLPGCAKRVVALCKEAGVVMTGAGATFPYGKDPKDSNIRIAPTLPPIAELEQAMKVFITAVKIASAEVLLAK